MEVLRHTMSCHLTTDIHISLPPTIEIINCVNSCNEKAIKDVLIFDIYCGEGVAEGHKSVALSLILQDFTQTLNDFEIDAIFNKVLEGFYDRINAKLRG